MSLLTLAGFFIYNFINKTTIESHKVEVLPPDKLYFYCDEITKMYKKNIIEKNILQKKELNKYRNLWNHRLNILNNEFIFNLHKNKFDNIIKSINDNDHYCIWVYRNNINELKNKKLLILDFKKVYDYTEKKLLDNKYINNISQFCHIHKIVFVIIGELNPSKFTDIKYFNKQNYLSPYNYKSKAFGSVQLLPNNNIAVKPALVTINKMILDIMNRYGILNKELIYIGNENIKNINCLN